MKNLLVVTLVLYLSFLIGCSLGPSEEERTKARLERYKASFTHWAPEPEKVIKPDSREEIPLSDEEFERQPWQVAWDETGESFYLLNASDLSIIKYDARTYEKEEINLNLVPSRVSDFTRYQDKFVILSEGFIFSGDEKEEITIKTDYSHGDLHRTKNGLIISNSDSNYIFEIYKDIKGEPRKLYKSKEYFTDINITYDEMVKDGIWVVGSDGLYWVVNECFADIIKIEGKNKKKYLLDNKYIVERSAMNREVLNKTESGMKFSYLYFYENVWHSDRYLFVTGRGRGGFYSYVINGDSRILTYLKLIEDDLFPVDMQYYADDQGYRVLILAEDFLKTKITLVILTFKQFNEE